MHLARFCKSIRLDVLCYSEVVSFSPLVAPFLPQSPTMLLRNLLFPPHLDETDVLSPPLP